MYIPFENALEQYMEAVNWPRRLSEAERNHAAEVLGRLVPVFNVLPDGRGPRLVSVAELGYGRFADGGRRLAYSDRHSLDSLVTTRAAIEDAIDLMTRKVKTA